MPRFDNDRRKRRIRRLSILGGALVLLVGLGTALYAINKTSDDEIAQQKLTEGRAAFEQGDYAQVVALLEDRASTTNTIRAIQRDPEALYLYVKARRELPLNNGEHISLLFPALRQVVALEPNNREAGVLLLQVQLLYGQESNALTTCTRLIEVHPKDIELLQYRAAVYERMGRPRDALENIWAALELEPLNVRAGADAARLTTQLQDDPERFVAWADDLVQHLPDDPRARVMQGQARLLQQDPLHAEEAFIRAAELTPPDQDFAEALVQWLERVGRFDLALAYLEHNAGPGVDNRLAEELLYRHYEAGRYDAALARFESDSTPSADTDLLAVVAMSAQRAGKDQLAGQLLARLQKGNSHAKAWANVLEHAWASPVNHGKLIAAAEAALKPNSENPYLSFILADALMQIGEDEAALTHLSTSARVRTTWARPRYLLATIFLKYGEAKQATDLAKAAMNREDNPAYADLEAAAYAYLSDPRDPKQLAMAVDRIEKAQAQSPGAPRSLLARVDLYRRANDPTGAQRSINQALTINPPLDGQTLIELARMADAIDPALAGQIRDRAESLYGQDAQLSLDRAMALASAGKIDEGAQLLRDQTPEGSGLPWQRAMAEYLWAVQSPKAVPAWMQLADAFPEDLGVQSSAVTRVPLSEHPAFAERAISRMRAIGGEESVGWRVAKAQLLLTGPQAQQPATVSEAGKLLQQVLAIAPNRADALRLISRVYELSGEPDNAIMAMQKANNVEPDNPGANFRLGQLLHQQRRFGEAQAPLLRVASASDAPLDLRLNAMLLLGQQGELRVLLPIAQAMVGSKLGGVRAQILLTEIYLTDGQINQAQQQAEQMLQTPTPQSIAYLAEFFERTNQPERAERTLALLDNVEMSQSERSEIRGLFASRRNDMESALGHFREAAEAAPDQPRRWRTLVAMDLLFNQPALAIQDAQRGQSHGINDAGITAVLNHQELISALAIDPRFARLAAAVVNDDTNRQAALAALQTIYEAATQRTPLDSVAQSFSEQAQASPKFLPLQVAAIQLLIQADLQADAADLALQTMERFPDDSESPRLAAVSLNSMGDWRRSALAADQWSKRAPEYRPFAAILLAAAQRNLGRPSDALTTLQPYVQTAQQQPEDYFGLLREYVWTLADLGRIDPAWAVVQPQLADSPAWRQVAGGIAAEKLPTADVAAAWLSAVAQTIPADNLGETLLLAQAELNAAQRLNNPALLASARERIDRVLTRTDAPAEALFLQGVIAETAGDLRQAEDSYRRLLRANPQAHLAMNNLAMLLLQRGQDAAEAVRYAEAATRARPDEPNYHDTLAQACLANRALDRALQAIDRAIELDRMTPAWYLTKADILEARGDQQGATILRERYLTQP